MAEKLLRQDRQLVWAASENFADVQKRLRLSKHYVRQAERERKAAEDTAKPVMPAQLGGKVLTATLKNSRPLCPDYQLIVVPKILKLASLGLICAQCSSSQAGHVVGDTTPRTAG